MTTIGVWKTQKVILKKYQHVISMLFKVGHKYGIFENPVKNRASVKK